MEGEENGKDHIEGDQPVERLKYKQRASLANITKSKNNLKELMEAGSENVGYVKEEATKYHVYCNNYIELSSDVLAVLPEEHRGAANDHIKANGSSAAEFLRDVQEWVQGAEGELYQQIDHKPVRSSSVRSRTSRASSRSSTSSRQKEKARLAELKVEQEYLKSQQEIRLKQEELKQEAQIEEQKLQLREQKLKCQEEEMKIKVEIAKAEARCEVYEEEASSMKSAPLQLKTEKTDPSSTARKQEQSIVTEVRRQPHTLTESIHANYRSTKTCQPENVTTSKGGKIVDAQTKPATPEIGYHPNIGRSSRETEMLDPNALRRSKTSTSEDFLEDLRQHIQTSNRPSEYNELEIQKRQNEAILETHRQLASAMHLPSPEVPKFHGSPLEYATFIRAFETRIAPHVVSNADKLYYLDQHLQGDAKDLISGCLHMEPDDGYYTARNLLKKQYGDTFKVSTAYMNRLLDWPPVKYDDSYGLQKLSNFLTKCYSAMQGIQYMTLLDHIPNLQTIVKKLPTQLQNKWVENVTSVKRRTERYPCFKDLRDFVEFAADNATEPAFSRGALYGRDMKEKSQKYSNFSAQVNELDSESSNQVCISSNVSCDVCGQRHDIENCKAFMQRSLSDRIAFLKDNKMCFGCYGHNHTAIGCLQRRICEICGRKHPTALHDPKFDHGDWNKPAETTAQATVPADSDFILQAIVPVQIHQSGSSTVEKTYALLDSGSTGCFMTDALKYKLNADSTATTLKLKTMNGIQYSKTSVITNLIVSDMKGENPVELPKVYTKEEIPVSHEQIPKPEMFKQWPHLQQLAEKIPDYHQELDIGLLIGNNCPSVMEPLRVISSEDDGPFAIQYRHGWTINGPYRIQTCGEKTVTCNRIMLQEVNIVKEAILASDVLQWMEMDFSEKDVGNIPGETAYSQEDQRFMDSARDGIQFVDEHYELPLPFRDTKIKFPNNRPQALKRALWQKKKMAKEESYRSEYTTFVQKLLEKGYAYKIPGNKVDELSENVRYLPHHAVYHPKKGKIRVVFDCSAKYQGSSLNDYLLTGPDLTNSLIGVLTRFRQEPHAFMADIESMFYQVRVPEYQRNALRFLWWPDGNLDAEIQEYCMAVHIFGAASSPSIANYALKHTADHAEKLYSPVVADTIRHNFYVDDCLKSVSDEQIGIRLARDLSAACAEGGFHLTKFTSNSKKILQSIPEHERTSGMQNLDLDDTSTMERALGVQWDIGKDTLGFCAKLKEKPTTRRGILSTVSSIYDPLGFIAPLILPVKKILQELCQEDIGWDEEISPEYKKRWAKWIHEVPLIEKLQIPRCLKATLPCAITRREIHVFSDASNLGYGAVAYIRMIDCMSNIHIAFLMGKARLSPRKTTTIPRLELTAATVAVKIGQQMLKELEVKVDCVTYHTDSTTVLHFINNKKKRFPIFVANRVKLILEFTTAKQWRFVDTNSNPADIASRGSDSLQMLTNTTWLKGPEFLHKPACKWPEQPTQVEEYTENEITGLASTVKAQTDETVNTLLTHFSSWERLRKAVAIYRKFLLYIRSKTDRSVQVVCQITVEELEAADLAIARCVQRQIFTNEIETLQSVTQGEVQRGRAQRKDSLHRSSTIYRLDPFLDSLSLVIRVGGRLRRANTSDMSKHPIILPYKHHVTTLVIRYIHKKTGHAGRNHVLSQLREKFWVIHANSAVRTVLSKCVTCRRAWATVSEQKMSDLPKERVIPSAPFTHTGVDYFGPFIVKEKRKELKRYGVLFTCLSSRAIHIETACSLDTSSFILSLRRFIARRGAVQAMWSDNGTNFRGAEKELKDALKEMDQHLIHDYLTRNAIRWTFNPPTASHMGGVWERLIRSVRKVLSPLVNEFGSRLDDESFRTLLCEVEAIVNSRPLTPLPSDPHDLTPLSPNHILTFKTSVITAPPGSFQREDVYMRKRWRGIQYLANIFWTRWKKEYLVMLQERQKWNRPKRNMHVGDIVIVKDDNLRRYEWCMGRVSSTESDDKGDVRSVMLRTQNGILRRPISKLVVLITAEDI